MCEKCGRPRRECSCDFNVWKFALWTAVMGGAVIYLLGLYYSR